MEYSSNLLAQEAYVTDSPLPLEATGGTITEVGGYKIHTFTSGGTFTPAGVMDIEILVVAGGGGGASGGGGGGAGGVIHETDFEVTAQGYTVTVGNGGNGGTSNGSGADGQDSVFSTLTAIKGGGGGGREGVGRAGGSGGGGGVSGSAMAGGSGTSGQGYAGGHNYQLGNYESGGGGGAGGLGQDGSASGGGNGGVGIASDISGSSLYYAGGGGGAYYDTGTGGNGGSSIGGNGGASPTVGAVNTGSGGGAGKAENTAGAAGGKGIVIIRYPYSSTPSLNPYSEGTIKTQGDYSLKIVAEQTNSLNNTVTKTFETPIDLTDQNTVQFDMRASRTGSNVQLKLQKGGTTPDIYNKLLLHLDNNVTDEAGKTITNSSVTFSDTVKKLGTHSAYFSGSASSYLSTPFVDDFKFGTGDFTIDFWIKRDASQLGNHNTPICQCSTGGTEYFMMRFQPANTFLWNFYCSPGMPGNIYAITTTSVISDTNWHHIACVRYGNTITMYLDGVADATTMNAAGQTLGSPDSSPLYLGVYGDYKDTWPAASFKGYLDEIRISKGIARWMADFDDALPTEPYTMTVSTIEDVTTLTPNISVTDEWQTIVWNLSEVANEDKEAITNLVVEVIDADEDNTIYLDNMFANPAFIKGIVTLEGSPIENAKIRAVCQDDASYAEDTLTDVNGNYILTKVDPTKKYHIMVEYESEGTKYNAKSKWEITPGYSIGVDLTGNYKMFDIYTKLLLHMEGADP